MGAGFQFPITLSVNPAGLLGQATNGGNGPDSSAWLKQLQLFATYAPLVLKARSDKQPGVASGRSPNVAASAKLAILGTKTIDDLVGSGSPEEIGLKSLLRKGAVCNGEPLCLQEVSKEVTEYMKPVTADLKRQFKLAVQLGYQASAQPVQPNSVSAELDASKILGTPHTPLDPVPVNIGGSLSETWFGRSSVGASYQKTSAALGPTVTLGANLDIMIQGSVDHYSGSGFPGIFPGVAGANPNLRNDVSLVQGITLGLDNLGFEKLRLDKIGIGPPSKLALSVNELHLGTGKTDVALAALFTFAPGRKHPKPAAPAG
jgi:hypothetical protein